MLEQRKLSLVQDIIQNDIREGDIRENLAKWQIRLEDRERALNIREESIALKEKSTIRNHNLLNL